MVCVCVVDKGQHLYRSKKDANDDEKQPWPGQHGQRSSHQDLLITADEKPVYRF
jgi:hypothetical protein